MKVKILKTSSEESAGMEQKSQKELLDALQRVSSSDVVSDNKKEFAKSMCAWISSGKPLTEKQQNFCEKIVSEFVSLESEGRWVVSPEDVEDIHIVFSISERYSRYFLQTHGWKAGIALRNLSTTKKLIDSGTVSFPRYYKRELDFLLYKMSKTISQIKSPQFKIGDMVFPDAGHQIGIVLDGPEIHGGYIEYLVDVKGTHKWVRVEEIHKRLKK